MIIYVKKNYSHELYENFFGPLFRGIDPWL